MNECYLNYPFGDCDNCKDITIRQTCIQGSAGYCGCKRKLGENDWKRTCELCGAIVCSECRVNDEHGESYCKTCSEKYVETDRYNLIHGDCLEEMKLLSDKSVDMILCDLPYGTIKCKWDAIIPFDKMWEQYNRIIKDNGAIVLFGSQPFTTKLISSNIVDFRYEIIWDKVNISNPMLAKKQPLKSHENILVFYKKQPTYNPQMEKGVMWKRGGNGAKESRHKSFEIDMKRECANDLSDLKYPKSIWTFSNSNRTNRLHPTQKDVGLLEKIIKTYTNEGETVLDNTMGSGSTGIACLNTNRRFVGIELDKQYFETAKKRIEDLNE